MREPTVASLMTCEVIAADVGSSFKELVWLLEDDKVSAVPVLDGGHPVSVGVVTLDGRLERRSEVEIAEHLVRALPGVVDVHNQLRCGWNDAAHPRQTENFG